MSAPLGQLTLLWSQFTWRHWRTAPWKTVILTSILALGVAVFFSIRLANRAAVAGFQLFSENVTGASDFVVTSPAGELPVEVLPAMRLALGDIPAGLFPVLEATAVEPTRNREQSGQASFHVLGVDLAALPNLVYLSEDRDRHGALDVRDGGGWKAQDPASPALYPSSTLVSQQGWQTGETVLLVFDDAVHRCTVASLLPESDLAIRQPANLIVMDLPVLQSITNQSDTIHRVEVRLPPGHWADEWKEKARHRLTSKAEGRWLVETPAQRRETGSSMTRAFRLNLSILSCLALVVGVYLILQALEAAVVRRRPEIATLRALGVPPGSIRRAWQCETLAMGVAGTLAGLMLGWLLAQVTVRTIAQTVNALYFSNTTQAAGWHWGEAALAGTLGIVASLAAGWLPARDAAATPPAQMLQRGARSEGIGLLRKPWLGITLLLLAWMAQRAPAFQGESGQAIPWAGYAAAFLWVIGAGVLGGALFPPISRLGQCFSERAPQRYYAASQLRQPTGRHRLATAGLIVAVAMAGGMSILVASFEITVIRWLDNVLKADLFVAPQGSGQASSRNRMHAETWRALRNDEAVASGEVSQFYDIVFQQRPVKLVGVGVESNKRMLEPIWLQEPAEAWLESSSPAKGIMSEPFAYRFRRSVGDVIQVPTPGGELEVELVGIFADYGNEFGSIVLPRETLSAWFGDDERVARLAVELHEDADLAAVQSRWMQAYPGITVTNNRELRAEALRIFRQTFAVTHGLKWIGVFVALAGLALALASMLMDRHRELTTLRALGLSRRDIGRASAWESLGLTLAGLTVGALLSLVLGHLIIYVINRQAFGWTLILDVPWTDFAALGAGLLAVSALVGYVTGTSIIKRPPASAPGRAG